MFQVAMAFRLTLRAYGHIVSGHFPGYKRASAKSWHDLNNFPFSWLCDSGGTSMWTRNFGVTTRQSYTSSINILQRTRHTLELVVPECSKEIQMWGVSYRCYPVECFQDEVTTLLPLFSRGRKGCPLRCSVSVIRELDLLIPCFLM